jgi:CHRD domain-containing protein
MRFPLAAALCAVVLAGACTDSTMSPAQPASITVPVRLQSEPRAGDPQTVRPESAPLAPHNLRTHLSGNEEVPARDTDAQGQAIFQVSEDGTAIGYKLIVANIENVTQAHIHLAPSGTNGGIVAWLYPAAPPSKLIPGRTEGILGEGEITASSLVGSLSGQPLSALLDAMTNGGAYVNVHTSQFPPGEIRGQVD